MTPSDLPTRLPTRVLSLGTFCGAAVSAIQVAMMAEKLKYHKVFFDP
jgi:hypothetical protein